MMLKKLTLNIFLLLLCSICLLAETYTVKQDGTGNFTTIQAAINYVVDDDVILVWPNDPDPYYENIDFNGKNIVVGSLFYTTQNTSYIEQTIIDGSEEGSVVTFNSGENSTAVLCGFTIQNGHGANYPNHTGGGIDCHSSNPTLENLIISENSSEFAGGGIYCYQSSPLIRNLSILNNTTQQFGGGLTCDYYSSPTIEDVTIFGNLTLETEPFSDSLFVFGDSLGSIVPYDPESDRDPTAGGGICIWGASNASLENVTIENNSSYGAGGVFCDFSNPSFLYVDVINNTAQHIGGMCFQDCDVILENVIVSGNYSFNCIGGIQCQESNLTMINVDILDNTAIVETGGINIHLFSDVSMFNVNIIGNSATGVGAYCGGIYLLGSCSAILENVNISYNSASYGGGIICWGDVSFTNVEFSHNSANFGAGICCGDNSPQFLNSTIADNIAFEAGGGIYCMDNSNPILTNSILWDNTPQEVYFGLDGSHNSITIDYSDIQDGQGGIVTNNNGNVFWGNGNIEDDPIFTNSGLNDYTLSWTETVKSPCIDTGDPESPLDPDETRADMGAYYLHHEIKTYEFPDEETHNGWKWLCFDILDKRIAYNTVYPMLEPIKYDLDYAECDEIGEQGTNIIHIEYFHPNWQNGDWEIISPQGYKFRTENRCEFDISGFRCDQYTTINVLAEQDYGNWIGYFLCKSQHVYDAFDGYLDNIYEIKAQHWSLRSPWPDVPDVPYTLNPGDMVIVCCDEDIREFCWSLQEQREPYIIEEPQSFSYEEESDYIPIYMQLDPEDLPTEIGALLDGECKGATVVQDTSAQICAYIMECQGGSLEFEFYYGGRAQNKVIKEYYVYDPETMQTEKTSIKLGDKKDCYYVSFKDEPASKPVPVKLEVTNYPNPFKPSGAGRSPVTTISYSLPNESEISLTIYNIKGQKVKELINGKQPAGDYNVSWDGKDENGKPVGTGLYFYKLKTKDKELTKKMLLLK